jgi:hypothetical protein
VSKPNKQYSFPEVGSFSGPFWTFSGNREHQCGIVFHKICRAAEILSQFSFFLFFEGPVTAWGIRPSFEDIGKRNVGSASSESALTPLERVKDLIQSNSARLDSPIS